MSKTLLKTTCALLTLCLVIAIGHIWLERRAYNRFQNREVAWFSAGMSTGMRIDYAAINIRRTPHGVIMEPHSGQQRGDDLERFLGRLQTDKIDRIIVHADPDVTVDQLSQKAELLQSYGIDKLFINGILECRISDPRQWWEDEGP